MDNKKRREMKKGLMIGVIFGALILGTCIQIQKFFNNHNELKHKVVKLEAYTDTLRHANTGLYEEVMSIKGDMEVIAGHVNMAKNVKELNTALAGYAYMYQAYFVPPAPQQAVKSDTSKTVKPDSVKSDSIKPVVKKRWSLFGHK